MRLVGDIGSPTRLCCVLHVYMRVVGETPAERYTIVLGCMYARCRRDTDYIYIYIYDCFLCFLAFVRGFQFEMPMYRRNVD